MKTKPCPDCKGKGVYYAVNVLREIVECVCITCDGMGKIIINDED